MRSTPGPIFGTPGTPLAPRPPRAPLRKSSFLLFWEVNFAYVLANIDVFDLGSFYEAVYCIIGATVFWWLFEACILQIHEVKTVEILVFFWYFWISHLRNVMTKRWWKTDFWRWTLRHVFIDFDGNPCVFLTIWIFDSYMICCNICDCHDFM